MPDFTPGPWEYRYASNYCGYSIAPVGTCLTLAAVERPRGNLELINIQCHNFPGQTEANARLIAAAPDLYAACKRALDAIGMEPVAFPATDEQGEMFDVVCELTAAIAKAEGRV